MLLSLQEAIPETYPTVTGMSDDAAALDAAPLWQRLEGWTAHRWTPRQVVWIVEGPQDWLPSLYPVTDLTAETFHWGDWQTVTLDRTATGYHLPGNRAYRITATVGADNPAPEGVLEAYRRLAEYLAAEPAGVPGATSHHINVGQMTETIRRHPEYLARALTYSGAADLLRPYRRAA